MTRLRQDTGKKGEQIALSFLLGLGYQLVEKNWRCRSGEIDLIMMDGPMMVFIEVKARRGTWFGLPQEAVGSKKQAKIRRLAQYYLMVAKRNEQDLRFDVVAVTFPGDREPLIEHLQGAF
ncbi:MAG: YraN family protein [Thermacetogeniaceae bacterium]|jgi:putative endonuclease